MNTECWEPTMCRRKQNPEMHEASMFYWQPGQPKRLCSPFHWNWLWTQLMATQVTFVYFLICGYFSEFTSWWPECEDTKGKDLFRSLEHSTKPNEHVSRSGGCCVLHLHCSSADKTHTQIWAAKYEQCGIIWVIKTSLNCITHWHCKIDEF